MELSALEAHVAVHDTGSFSQAARQLHLSQPALTKRIQQLERTIGGQLFDRSRHGAVLTKAGRDLLETGRKLIGDHAAWRDQASRIVTGETGRLAVGFDLSTIHIAPTWISLFRAANPGVVVTLDDLPSREQIVRMRMGRLHAGFVRTAAVPDGFDSVPGA